MSTTQQRIQLTAEHATLNFLVSVTYHNLFGTRTRLEHALGDGNYFTDHDGKPITQEQCDQIAKSIREKLETTPIEFVSIERDELLKKFAEMGFDDKIGIMKTWQDSYVSCIQWGNDVDYKIEDMSTDKARLSIFDIRPYAEGMVVRFPNQLNPDALGDWRDPKVFLKMFSEYKEWAKLLKVDNVSKLNQMIYAHQVTDIKWLAEGLHNKKFAAIASHLVENFDKKRIVTVAGPSSSNKTTFAKRLAIALRVNGYNSIVMEMDDFYKNRDDIPYGPDGLQDFESITALNTDVLSQRVASLLAGESVPRRKFDFKQGIGIDDTTNMITLPPNTFLILEGIHGLNPQLLNSFGRDKVTPIYVSALTPLNIDDNHRFPTSDLRLIRRMIRDFNFRGYSPRKTLSRWTSVRVGEVHNIFPYQDNAELFFNSSLVYEIPVLSIYGKALLAEATIPEPDEDPNSPEAKLITKEARRLLNLLNFFYPISVETVPHISCIREFVGGSDIKY